MAGHDAGQALSAQQRERGEPIRPRQGSEGPGKEEVGGHDRAPQWAHGTYHGGTEYVTERLHVAALLLTSTGLNNAFLRLSVLRNSGYLFEGLHKQILSIKLRIQQISHPNKAVFCIFKVQIVI